MPRFQLLYIFKAEHEQGKKPTRDCLCPPFAFMY